TSTLFDTVTFANVIEGQLDTNVLEMPVRAYAIQTENTGGSETEIVKKATVAYEKYVNQNQGQDGKVTR
ncbi:MAG: Camelysin metallo-endopeptidase, partial [Blautia sp.]|nr:Camelysin metallo-endopeptidase [Blautia sp.]